MCDGDVGLKIGEWLLNNYREDVSLAVALPNSEVNRFFKSENVATIDYQSEKKLCEYLSLNERYDLGLLVWWPKIISKQLIVATKNGFINTHPSYLPFNRGKHFSFWAIVEQVPFGVSLHLVDSGIDSGPVIAQSRIDYDWEDTGGSLYSKAKEAMFELFVATYPAIRQLNYPIVLQDLQQGSFHDSKEIKDASTIKLDDQYVARDLLNLLRAKMFQGHSPCFFEDNGKVYDVRISIVRRP
jgi:methionyl-tRNA formyltransferase